ncbi:hypothetical protein O9929_02835 [Vibrio lentus]|nr:hypothetical protein [Vibrio lentus]
MRSGGRTWRRGPFMRFETHGRINTLRRSKSTKEKYKATDISIYHRC